MASQNTMNHLTKRMRLLGGFLAVSMGLVSVAANWPYLLGTAGEDQGIAWVAAGCGTAAIAAGVWLWLGPRSQGKALVLTRRQWRYGFTAVMITMCAALLVAALSATQPSLMTGVPSLLVISFLLQLFVPEGSEKDETVPFSEAQRRTWWRGIISLLTIGVVASGSAIALALAGNALAASFLVLFGVLFLVLAAMMRRRLAQRQEEP
ncbi:hypothetical protein [Kocuria rosea]|uniref:Uncharacterized protein n=1 Tax=Kocuria rosea TaxID=1275 RepID=A0A4R5YDA8_KOCRO|nr:hypothetical protein [Kocuria rosea]TDL43040.1 hypothetical protein E2R59_09470 [Kocuria rosea]